MGGRPNLVYSPGPGLWSLVLGPFGPDLGPDLDLTWDLDLGPGPGPELDDYLKLLTARIVKFSLRYL